MKWMEAWPETKIAKSSSMEGSSGLAFRIQALNNTYKVSLWTTGVKFQYERNFYGAGKHCDMLLS